MSRKSVQSYSRSILSTGRNNLLQHCWMERLKELAANNEFIGPNDSGFLRGNLGQLKPERIAVPQNMNSRKARAAN